MDMEARVKLMDYMASICFDHDREEMAGIFNAMGEETVSAVFDELGELDAVVGEHVTPEILGRYTREEQTRLAQEYPGREQAVPEMLLQMAVWRRIRREVFPKAPQQDD